MGWVNCSVIQDGKKFLEKFFIFSQMFLFTFFALFLVHSFVVASEEFILTEYELLYLDAVV